MAGRGDPELYGKAPADLDAFVRALRRALDKYALAREDVAICYEAGPTGFVLARRLWSLGFECEVAAPSLIPEKASDRIAIAPSWWRSSGNSPRRSKWNGPRPIRRSRCARRRHLLALGTPPEQVHLASRSRKGYWRMSGNSILQRAVTNHRLHEMGAPDLRAL